MIKVDFCSFYEQTRSTWKNHRFGLCLALFICFSGSGLRTGTCADTCFSCCFTYQLYFCLHNFPFHASLYKLHLWLKMKAARFSECATVFTQVCWVLNIPGNLSSACKLAWVQYAGLHGHNCGLLRHGPLHSSQWNEGEQYRHWLCMDCSLPFLMVKNVGNTKWSRHSCSSCLFSSGVALAESRVIDRES